jgi:hypothetical protein
MYESTLPHQVWVIFFSLFGIVSEEIRGMVKITGLYQIPGYKTHELVVESELISNSYHYDPCPTSILKSNNPILAEQRTYVPVHNMDEDEEEEKWHLNVEEDDIHDAIDINIDKIEDEIDVKEIVKE